MSETSKIEWTDATWNPIVGCSMVSPACTNCYAMAMAARIERMTPGSHYAGTTETVKGKAVWTGTLKQAPDDVLLKPLRWKKPRRIFVNSMSDLFHENVPGTWIDRVFAVMALAPQHTFQVLTKRPARMLAYFEARRDGDPWAEAADEISDMLGMKDAHAIVLEPKDIPLPNVWLGVTAEDQKRAEERVGDLLATPAAVRFVSCEPALGMINFTAIKFWSPCNIPEYGGEGYELLPAMRPAWRKGNGPGLDWIIAGGESGPAARPSHPDWFRSLASQCQEANVPFFFKQWGEWLGTMPDEPKPTSAKCHEWNGGVTAWCIGKRRAGRLLDGVEHNAFPEPHP